MNENHSIETEYVEGLGWFATAGYAEVGPFPTEQEAIDEMVSTY